MNHRSLFIALLLPATFAWTGCTTFSKVSAGLSNKKSGNRQNPEQMRIAADVAVFQPALRVDVPQFSGLQTPLTGGNRGRTNAGQPALSLPRFTPVTVLSNNGRFALILLKNGQRGYVPSSAIATESAILATAQPALPVQPAYGNNMPIDPATGLPYDPQALYLPRIDAGDAPVDQAMLNNIDSIPLPESEKHAGVKPEAQEVDGVVLRSTSATAPTPAAEVPPPSN